MSPLILLHLPLQVLSARTMAVGLASSHLAARGADTLEQLDGVRQELARVQGEWGREQGEWRREREEARIHLEGVQARYTDN